MNVNRMARLLTAVFFGLLTLSLWLGATPAHAATQAVYVCINSSDSTPLVPGTTYYRLNSGPQLFFGTGVDGSCKTQDFDVSGPTNLEVWTTYNGTTSAHVTKDISVYPNYVFQTRKVTLRLETCDGDPLDGGKASFGSGGAYSTRYFPDNPGLLTGSSSPGEIAGELFPGTYSFEMQYQGTADRKLSVAVPDADTMLTWQTTTVTIDYPGSVSYGGSGDARWFKQTTAPASMELLAGTYTFHFRDTATTPGFTEAFTFSGCSYSYPEVTNQAPIANPGGPYVFPLDAGPFDGSGSSDPDGDALTYAWDFGDGGTGTGVSPTHTYSAPGIYEVCLIVNDSQVDSDEACTPAVIYDPSAGFVTGGGWINSPAGAYKADANLAGKATFGFVARYKKGASVPDGQTEFQFKAGDLNFHSTSYDWLVVTGGNTAMFKGTGTINGAGNYRFQIWAGDKPDTFRIMIWGDQGVAYDNGSNQAIGGGSIVIHS